MRATNLTEHKEPTQYCGGGLPHRDFLLVVNYRLPEERMKLNYNDLGTFLIFWCVRKDFQWKFKMREVIVKSGQVAVFSSTF